MGTDEFIKNESLAGPLMIFPWLRHLPFIAAKFRASKSHPLKMRQLQVGKKIKGMCGPDENKRCRLDHDTWHDRSTVTHYVMQQLRTYYTTHVRTVVLVYLLEQLLGPQASFHRTTRMTLSTRRKQVSRRPAVRIAVSSGTTTSFPELHFPQAPQAVAAAPTLLATPPATVTPSMPTTIWPRLPPSLNRGGICGLKKWIF